MGGRGGGERRKAEWSEVERSAAFYGQALFSAPIDLLAVCVQIATFRALVYSARSLCPAIFETNWLPALVDEANNLCVRGQRLLQPLPC